MHQKRGDRTQKKRGDRKPGDRPQRQQRDKPSEAPAQEGATQEQPKVQREAEGARAPRADRKRGNRDGQEWFCFFFVYIRYFVALLF